MTDTPSWTAFDPDAPPGLTDLAGAGLVVGIVASPTAAADGWGAPLAAELARAWSQGGIRLILADGALDAPSLHEAVGMENDEGIADALAFGASVRRVAKRVADHGYFVVVAGTVVADAVEAMSHGRWADLCAGFREAGVTLAVYLRSEDAASEIALREASHVLMLMAEDEAVPPVVTDCGASIIGVVGRDSDWVPAALDVDEAPDLDSPPDADDVEVFADDAAPEAVNDGNEVVVDEAAGVDPLADDEAVGQDDPVLAPAPEDDNEAAIFERAMEAAERDEEPVAPLDEILEETEGGQQSTGRRNSLVLLLLVVVVGVLAAGWLGYVEIPGITPTGSTVAPVEATDAPVAVAPAVVESPVQAYSVALGAYGDAAAAAAVVAQLRTAVPDAVFCIVPVDVDGRTFHRALAGPAVDSAGAAALLTSVADATGLDSADWVVRSTPLAYELGEMPELEAANRRAEVLEGLDVPAYVLAVDYTDGSSRYRVYAGAYADEAEASALVDLLTDRGLNAANLSDRKGRLPE